MTIRCRTCPALGVAAPGRAPAGWVVSGDMRACGACWRRAIGRKG